MCRVYAEALGFALKTLLTYTSAGIDCIIRSQQGSLMCRSPFRCGLWFTCQWLSQSQQPSSLPRAGCTASCTSSLRMLWALSRWAQLLLVSALSALASTDCSVLGHSRSLKSAAFGVHLSCCNCFVHWIMLVRHLGPYHILFVAYVFCLHSQYIIAPQYLSFTLSFCYCCRHAGPEARPGMGCDHKAGFI